MTGLAPSHVPVSYPAARKPPVKTAYRCRVITEPKEFEALQPQWDAFLEASGINNLCLTHGFLQAWLSHFPPEKLFVLIVENPQGQWVGLAPLQINRSRKELSHRLLKHLQWVGTDPTVYDWMQLVISPDSDETAVIQAMAQTLQQTGWDVLDLQFCLDPSQLRRLCAVLGLQPAETALWRSDAMPIIRLPENPADYEPMRRKKTRLEVKRHCNALDRDFEAPLQLRFETASLETNRLVDRFIQEHIQYWAERGSKSNFCRYPALGDFYKSLLAADGPPQKPRLRFSVLSVGEEILSYHIGFWQGNSYLTHLNSYNQALKQYSPGTVHMDKLVFEALECQAVEFSFGRGDQAYKTMWTKEKKPLWALRLFRNRSVQKIWEVDPWLKRKMRKEAAP